MGILCEPLLAFVFKIVTRPIVDNEEHLSRRILRDQVLQELQKGLPVENLCELKREARLVEADRSENVCGLALSEGIDAWLKSDA